MRTARVGAALAALTMVVAGTYAGTVSASPIVLPNGVQERPSAVTPNVENGGGVDHAAVYALKDGGSMMYAGGQFQRVSTSSRVVMTRHHLFRFNATTGAIDSWTPNMNGPVWAIETDPATNSLWVGGYFTSVNGVARNGIVKFNTATGAVDTSFSSGAVSGPVTEIKLVNGRLIVGGGFSRRLLSLNPQTGANDGSINVSITGRVPRAGRTDVYRFAVDPAGTRLVAVGNFTAVNGTTRHRAFMLNLSPAGATLNPWYYQPLENACRAGQLAAYLRDVDFSSDGSWFAIVSTGFVPQVGGLGRDLCDATARFETNIANPIRPTWINYTGGDTLHSVAITGNSVFIQGHHRWVNNAGGTDNCNVAAGCVSRPGISELNAVTGRATEWNPTKTRGVGGKDTLVTAQGLWVASDGNMFNGRYHHGIAFCPRN